MARKLMPSMLFVPGGDEAKLEKLWSLDVRRFVLDLEDAVAISRKVAARGLVKDQLDRAAGQEDRELWVRINGMDTPYALGDLRAIVRPGLGGILVPKVGSARDVQIVDWIVTQIEAEQGLSIGEIGLLAILESAQGIANAYEIAKSSPRLACMAFGAGDLTADLGVDVHDAKASAERRAFIISLKAQLVVASSAAGLNPPHDGVYTAFRDLDGLRESAELSRELGYFGRHAIHPGQIPVLNEVFSPRAEEIEWAERIVREFGEQEASGSASILVGGEFVDYAIAVRAQRILDLAGANGA